MLLPNYRDAGADRLIHTAYLLIEKAIRRLGYQYASILTVKRDETDACKPRDYRELEKIWAYLGFQKVPELETKYYWNAILPHGNCEEAENIMEFWQKHLA